MTRPRRYTVHESFYTFQGEGAHMGRAAFFIRLQGCDQRCWFCDAAATWHPDYVPRGMWKGGPDELADLAQAGAAEGAMVVITGGEPAMYDLDPLIDALHAHGRYVALETAGHHPLPELVDWVALSPKPFAAPPLPGSVRRADELKVIVSDERSLRDGLALCEERRPDAVVWLHPEWSHARNPSTLRLITESVKRDPGLRAGWQVHKNYMADLYDPAARVEPVPLGGGTHPPY